MTYLDLFPSASRDKRALPSSTDTHDSNVNIVDILTKPVSFPKFKEEVDYCRDGYKSDLFGSWKGIFAADRLSSCIAGGVVERLTSAIIWERGPMIVREQLLRSLLFPRIRRWHQKCWQVLVCDFCHSEVSLSYTWRVVQLAVSSLIWCGWRLLGGWGHERC
jgi:hypothetical protein